MTPEHAIATLGFRRWYERQLLESHVCLVACFLCTILLAVCLESALPRSGFGNSFAALLTALASATCALWSWNHYRVVFSRAGRYGNVAHCEHCGTYGRFDVERANAGDRVDEPVLKVRCRHCSHRWSMPEAPR
jgi:hypothetical protein